MVVTVAASRRRDGRSFISCHVFTRARSVTKTEMVQDGEFVRHVKSLSSVTKTEMVHDAVTLEIACVIISFHLHLACRTTNQ